MSSLMPFVDVLIANEEDAEKVFGIKASDTDVTGGNCQTKDIMTFADNWLTNLISKRLP